VQAYIDFVFYILTTPCILASHHRSITTVGASFDSACPAGTHPHVPVLLEEVLSFFAGQQVTKFVDGTLGAGAHTPNLLATDSKTSAIKPGTSSPTFCIFATTQFPIIQSTHMQLNAREDPAYSCSNHDLDVAGRTPLVV